jgi:hypothetical protein
MRSSIVPQSARLGTEASVATTLGFAAEDGDTVFIFNPVSQTYLDPFVYFDGIGWTGPDPDPEGPQIAVATGFFVQKSPTAAKTSWSRTFSVN